MCDLDATGAPSMFKVIRSAFLFVIAVVYYESMKRELNKRLIFECRCDTRLKLKLRDLHAWHTLGGARNRNT